MVNHSFVTLTHYIKSQFSALLEFRFGIHSVLPFNLPRQHSLFRSQLWKVEQVSTSWVLRASFKAFFSLIKVKCEFWNHHTSKMGDFSLNPLKFFTENCYRNLAKLVTPVRFSFSFKFINNFFDKFNNIRYCFLLSVAAIESHPGNQLNKMYFATNQLLRILKVFLEFCTYFTIFTRVQ